MTGSAAAGPTAKPRFSCDLALTTRSLWAAIRQHCQRIDTSDEAEVSRGEGDFGFGTHHGAHVVSPLLRPLRVQMAVEMLD